MKMFKLMMDWVDARVNSAISQHNAEFHREESWKPRRMEIIDNKREAETRNKLKKVV
jgi:hypothetical protein